MNWLPMGLSYAMFYCTRYNVAAGNVKTVQDEVGLPSPAFAFVITSGFWTYAMTAPLTGIRAATATYHLPPASCHLPYRPPTSPRATAQTHLPTSPHPHRTDNPPPGIVTDRIGGRNGMIVAIAGAAVCNLGLGWLFSTPSVPHDQLFPLFAGLYSANIFFQGFGTSAVVKINAAWYAPVERGVFSGIFNVILTSGYYLALGASPAVVQSYGWPYVFLMPGTALVVCFFMAVIFGESRTC